MLSGPRAAGASWRAGACGAAQATSAASKIMYFMREICPGAYPLTTLLGRFQPFGGPKYPTSVPTANRSPGKTMRRRLMVAALLLVAAVAPASAQDSTWTWHKSISAGQTLRIKNILGDI